MKLLTATVLSLTSNSAVAKHVEVHENTQAAGYILLGLVSLIAIGILAIILVKYSDKKKESSIKNSQTPD